MNSGLFVPIRIQHRESHCAAAIRMRVSADLDFLLGVNLARFVGCKIRSIAHLARVENLPIPLSAHRASTDTRRPPNYIHVVGFKRLIDLRLLRGVDHFRPYKPCPVVGISSKLFVHLRGDLIPIQATLKPLGHDLLHTWDVELRYFARNTGVAVGVNVLDEFLPIGHNQRHRRY